MIVRLNGGACSERMCKFAYAGGLKDENDFNCNEGLAKRRFGRLSMKGYQRTDKPMCKVREWISAAFL